MIERNDENERSYHRQIKASEILAGEVAQPYWSSYKGLLNTILAGEDKKYAPELIPKGFSPSESLSREESAALAARRLPPSPLEDEDVQARMEMEEEMRRFGIEETEAEAHRQAREADPHLQRETLHLHTGDRSSTALGTGTPQLDATATSSPDSNLRPLSLVASLNGSPPILPPRRFAEPQEEGRPIAPPRCDSEASQSPLLVEVGEGEAPPPTFEEASGRASTETARSDGASKPPVPPRRRSLRVPPPAVGASTATVAEPAAEVEGKEGEGVGEAAVEEDREPESDATSFVDAESEAGEREDAPAVEEGKASE